MKSLLILIYLSFLIAFPQKEIKHQVYFLTDQYDIPETEESRLLLFLSEIENMDVKKISIYGFCDDRGSDSYNLVLSQQRADAIKEVFSNNEFDESVITNVDGKGEILLNVVHDNDLYKIRGLNRKVEIIVQPYDPPREKAEQPEKESTEELLKGELKEGDKIQLENILFRTGYSYLTKESKVKLDDIAKILVERTDIYFTIEGHVCCTYGTRDAIDRKTKKRNLSLARAKRVYDYLAEKGVKRYRMKFVGHRRKFPLGGEPELDRRVEILVTRVIKKTN
ncbi:OmpA family protein [Winogradskyella flava]|uniref:OmpA family protein n=1 Tax=Winogradskyella flava TaxID=1884876 RepID=A0A842IQA4_9FLAO|nr:OmpA family protein [Winogradskyella flava]MBC2843904.1 OmpA family protein [Winogradskyella flava]